MQSRFASLALIVAYSLCPLATFAHGLFEKVVSGEGVVRMEGWARLKGELMLYPDRESMNQEAKFPRCISGVFHDQYTQDLTAYDGRRVVVTGKLFKYSDLPDENRPVIPRKVLADSVIPNFCLGSNVLLIESIKILGK